MKRGWQLFGFVVSPLFLVGFWVQSRLQKTTRPRLALVCSQEVLLVQEWRSRKWSFPGGGIKRGESNEQALVREAHEELGLILDEVAFQFVAMFDCGTYYAPLYEVTIRQKQKVRIHRLEITDARWIRIDQLPALERHTHSMVEKLSYAP